MIIALVNLFSLLLSIPLSQSYLNHGITQRVPFKTELCARNLFNRRVQRDEGDDVEESDGGNENAWPTKRSPRSSSQSARVFVSNLKFDTTVGELKEFMGVAGDIKAVNLFQRPDGRPVGSAVIEFNSPDAAGKAIETLHENEFLGRRVFVREDREEDSMEDKRPTGRGGRDRGGDRGRGEGREWREDNRQRRGDWGRGEGREWREDGRERRDFGRDRREEFSNDFNSDRPPRSSDFQKYRQPMRATPKFRDRDEASFDRNDRDERGGDGERRGRRRFDESSNEDRPSRFDRRDRSSNPRSENSLPNEDTRKILIVENIPLKFSWQDLKDVIKDYGMTVRVDVVSVPPTEDRPRRANVGIAEFKFREDVQSIIEDPPFSEKCPDLIFRAVHSKDEYMSLRQNTPRGKRLFVGNIPQELTWEQLKDHFKTIGDVVKATVIVKEPREQDEDEGSDRRGGRRGGRRHENDSTYGIVEFVTLEDADKAVELLNGSILGDVSTPIIVRKFRE